jgi:hypothetical protein
VIRTKSIFRLLFAVCLLVSTALADFRQEMWQTTWQEKEKPAPLPLAPWKPAMWTMGKLTYDWTSAKDIRQMAILCRDGGRIQGAIDPRIYEAQKMQNGWEIFPGEVVPANTLLIADYEGMDERPIDRKAYREVLCQTVRSVTSGYVQYPGFLSDPWWTYAWQSRITEADLLVLERAFTNTAKKGTWQHPLRMAVGDYMLVELYLTPEDENDRFRAWALLLAKTRKHFPKLKILGLVRGEYAPAGAVLSDDSRHRLARFVVCVCDGVWMWGPRAPAIPLMRDIEAVVGNPDVRFEGQEGWVK